MASCAAPSVSSTPEVDGELEELQSQGRTCRDARSCPLPAGPCRLCDDGSFVCPRADCVKQRCVYSVPECPPPYDPCGGKACGDLCTICNPADPDCVETAVVKMCQPDGGCSPKLPECAPPTDPCAAVRCKAGTHCEAGSCVPDGDKVFCGGFAGFPCPGAGSCIDDPSDDCDPQNGGADCGGLCICPKTAVCPTGSIWNSLPSVCACVPGNKCGPNTCGDGQFCCNPSCGTCAPRGGVCIQIACGVTL